MTSAEKRNNLKKFLGKDLNYFYYKNDDESLVPYELPGSLPKTQEIPVKGLKAWKMEQITDRDMLKAVVFLQFVLIIALILK